MVGSSSGIVTRSSRVTDGSDSSSCIQPACSRMRPAGTSSVIVRGARRNEPIWPVGGPSTTTDSHPPRRTSHSTFPIVTISRIAGAAEARASKARRNGPNAASGGRPTWTWRYSTRAFARSTTMASRPGRISVGSNESGGPPRWEVRPPPAPVIATARTRRPSRWSASATAAAYADFPTPPFPDTSWRRAGSPEGIQSSEERGIRSTRFPSSTLQAALPTRAKSV